MSSDHVCRFIEEQQTNHRFCGLCGKHDPPQENCPDRPSALWRMLTDPEWPATHKFIVREVRKMAIKAKEERK